MGRMIESQREEVIRKILKLREFDKHGIQMSWAVVASKLNDEGVSTFSGEGKWDAGTMRRIIATYVKQKAEVRVGVKTELEIELDNLRQADIEKQAELESVKAEVERLKSENVRLSESASHLEGLQKDRDELVVKNKELQSELDNFRQCESDSQKEIDRLLKEVAAEGKRASDKQSEIDLLLDELDNLRQKLDNLRQNTEEAPNYIKANQVLTSQNIILSKKVDNLNRSLTEIEALYRERYEFELSKLSKDLAESREECQLLRGQKIFEIEKFGTNWEGWTIQKRSGGTGFNICRHIEGKQVFIYIGKDRTILSIRPDLVREKIRRKLESLDKFRQSEKEAAPQPSLFVQPAQSFEERLRTVCLDRKRTYRLDTVRKLMRSSDLGRIEFDSNMLDLASKQIIELVGGDPRQCDVADLLRDVETHALYVNFEWRETQS